MFTLTDFIDGRLEVADCPSHVWRMWQILDNAHVAVMLAEFEPDDYTNEQYDILQARFDTRVKSFQNMLTKWADKVYNENAHTIPYGVLNGDDGTLGDWYLDTLAEY